MNNKNKVIWALSTMLLLLILVPVIAHEQEGKVYVINLNYKKQQSIETLTFLNAYITQGNSINYGEPISGYRMDVLSQNNEILESIKFSVPIGSVALEGLVRDNVEGTQEDLNFTIYAPFFDEGKTIEIYDKNNIKVVSIPVEQGYGLGQSETIEGQLEVIHTEDFENPENSKYFFYLNTGTKRYELVSEKSIPTVRSGTRISVTGKLLGNKLAVEDMALKPELGQTSLVKEITLNEFEKKPGLRLNWLYVAVGVLVSVITFSLFHFYNRNKGNKSKLKNYVLANLKKDYSKKQIRDALSRNGYSAKDIEEAFKGIR